MDLNDALALCEELATFEELPELLRSITSKAVDVSGARRGCVLLAERDGFDHSTALASSIGGLKHEDLHAALPLASEALSTGRAVQAQASGSAVCVPFGGKAALRGVLYADRPIASSFEEQQRHALRTVGAQAAFAILNLRRAHALRHQAKEARERLAQQETELAELRRALRRLGETTAAMTLVGESAPMRATRRQIERAAASGQHALIVAPAGSGRRAAARALHFASARANGPILLASADDGTLRLQRSDLFGDGSIEGLLQLARGGTLFIDEIGALAPELQAALGAALDGTSAAERALDVRLVAGAGSDLAQEVLVGRFDARLHARLEGQRVLIAPLSTRRDDVPALVEHYLRRRAALGGTARRASPEVIAALARRPWPGHVRELFDELGSLCALSPGDLVDPTLIRPPGVHGSGAAASMAVKPFDVLEREAILQALEVTGNDKRKAAELLGISRAKVYQRLKVWGLI